MSVEVAYSELLPGDVIAEYDTLFVVTSVLPFTRRDRTVWLVTTVAVTEPSRVLAGLVGGVGAEYQIQGSGLSARTMQSSFEVEQRAGGYAGKYARVTQAVIGGAPCRITYRIDEVGFASVRIGNLSTGEQAQWHEVGHVDARDMPGLVNASKTLGKLIRF